MLASDAQDTGQQSVFLNRVSVSDPFAVAASKNLFCSSVGSRSTKRTLSPAGDQDAISTWLLANTCRGARSGWLASQTKYPDLGGLVRRRSGALGDQPP